MRVRAIKDLMRLGEPAFFAAIAEGLELIVQNVSRLYDGAITLAKASQPHAAHVLTTLAEEEAAKVLILLDAVRCPQSPADRLSHQLARFNDHLAKGLYARVCGMRPATLAQLQECIDNDREEFYLDGPNDVDWIFRNQVTQDREGIFYVDYVAHDDGHRWSDPAVFEEILCSSPPMPDAVRMALNPVECSRDQHRSAGGHRRHLACPRAGAGNPPHKDQGNKRTDPPDTRRAWVAAKTPRRGL